MITQKKLFSLMTALIFVRSITGAISEVAQKYQKDISSSKMSESQVEEVMQSILFDISGSRSKLQGANFAEKLADFYLHDFQNDFSEYNTKSFSIKEQVKQLLDKHNTDVLNNNPEPFFEEVLPLLRNYYSHQILVENKLEIYEFGVLIKQIEDVISIKKEKSAAYAALKLYTLKSLKIFIQESYNLFSIQKPQELFNLIYDSGIRLFTSVWSEIDTLEQNVFEENLSKLEEIVKAFLTVSIDMYKDEDQKAVELRENLPNQQVLIYYILREGKTSMEKKANSPRQTLLLKNVVKVSAETFYSLLTEKKANANIVYLLNDFFTVSSESSLEIEKFLSQFIHQKFNQDGIAPVSMNDSEMRIYWIDVFTKIIKFYNFLTNKNEISKLLDRLDNVFSIKPHEFALSKTYLNIYKSNLLTEEIDQGIFEPLDKLYHFYSNFISNKVTQNEDKLTIVEQFQDYLLESRLKEHPELNQEKSESIVDVSLSTEDMILGKNYLLFELMLLEEQLGPKFTFKFAKNFTKEELGNVVQVFQTKNFDEIRKLNYCIWKKLTGLNLTKDLVADVSNLETILTQFAGKTISQEFVDSSLTITTENGGKGC